MQIVKVYDKICAHLWRYTHTYMDKTFKPFAVNITENA